jgi:hypothetical protein
MKKIKIVCDFKDNEEIKEDKRKRNKLNQQIETWSGKEYLPKKQYFSDNDGNKYIYDTQKKIWCDRQNNKIDDSKILYDDDDIIFINNKIIYESYDSHKNIFEKFIEKIKGFIRVQ